MIALDTILPKIAAFCSGFDWRDDEFVVRDAKWVDLSKHPAGEPYFLSQCLQAGRKDSKTMVFKTKQFALMVVAPQARWLEYENWAEQLAENGGRTLVVQSAAVEDDEFLQSTAYQATTSRVLIQSAQHTTTPTGLGNDDSGLYSQSAPRTLTGFGNDDSGLYSQSAPQMKSTLATQSAPQTKSTLATQTHMAVPATSKWTHVRTESSSRALPPSPPHKKIAPTDVVLCSPDRDNLKAALRSGGIANLNVKKVFEKQNETIHFYPIPKRPLTEILRNEDYRSFTLDAAESWVGQLTVDVSHDGMIGMGGFKTAHPGWLTLTPPPVSGFGSAARHEIVAKRPFHPVYPQGVSTGPFKIGRFPVADELPKLFREANVLYWASSLLQLTYDFIDCRLASYCPPPFPIPRVRFVEAGLALAFVQGPAVASKPGSKTCPIRVGYLLEELISGGDDAFIKFIHNTDANPLLEELDYGYDLAVFFSFTQHVQYVKTGGLAFISDYQGSTGLLTDPQILTDPSVSGGLDIFGDGNIEVVVTMFEAQHTCNDYCEWAGLEKYPSRDETVETKDSA
ncbi:hypothetical protein DEU56DRAFT_919630 [Suillus clintonianus]|uniref:uncharacterized protein n=1 Tax=Suillus clintonianus TaxID=1904413 RepID=UPI001B872455|nr:uncharacterized protein DEU56DRAFT_919630 [Suillus clintonianus]KAG2114132.1 hypothetical protein DEU56DRAFT_919630 [Suillus clintonianus]